MRDELRTNQIQKLWSKTVDRATRRLDSWGPELPGSSSRQLTHNSVADRTGPSSLTIMAVTGGSNADDDDDSTNDDDLGHFRLETMMPMSSLPAMFGGSSRIGNKPLPPPKPSNIRLIAAANGVVASLNRCNNNGKPQLQPKPNACARTVPSSVPSRLIAPSRSCASKASPNIADKEPRIQKEINPLDIGMKEHQTTVVEVASEKLEAQHSLQLTCQPVSELIFESTDGPGNKLLEKSSTTPFPTMTSSDNTNLITVPTPAENITPLVISTSFPVPHFIQVSNTHGLSEKPYTIGSLAGPLAEQETLSMVQDDQEDLAGNLCLRKEHRDWASETAKHERNLEGFENEVEWRQDQEEINVEKDEKINQVQERVEETQQKDEKIENTNQEVEKINRIVITEEQSQSTERKMEQGEEEGKEREEIIMEQLVDIEKELNNTGKMSAVLIGRSCSDKTGSTHVNEVVPATTVPALTVPAMAVPAVSAECENHKSVPTSLNLTPASKNECIPSAGKPFLPGGDMTYLASSPVDSLGSLETISNILDQGLHSLQHRKHSVGSRKDSGIGLEDFSPTWEQDIEEEAISEEDSGDVLLSSRSEEEEAALKSPDPPPRRPSFQRSQLPVPANRSAHRRSQPDSGRSTPSGARSFAATSSGLRQPAVYFNLGPRPFYSSSTAASGSQSLLSLPVVRTCHGNGNSSNKTANSRGSTAHLHHIPRQNLPANLVGRPSSSNFLSGWPNRSPVTYAPSPTYRSSYGSLSCIDLHQGLTASLSSSPDELLVWEGGSGRSTPSCRRPLSGSRIPLRMVNSGLPRRASLPPTSLASHDSGHFWPPSEAKNVWKTSSVHEVSWSMRGML